MKILAYDFTFKELRINREFIFVICYYSYLIVKSRIRTQFRSFKINLYTYLSAKEF